MLEGLPTNIYWVKSQYLPKLGHAIDKIPVEENQLLRGEIFQTLKHIFQIYFLPKIIKIKYKLIYLWGKWQIYLLKEIITFAKCANLAFFQ